MSLTPSRSGIEVTDVNEPPSADAAAATTFEDTSVEIYVLDDDSDPEDEPSELRLTVFNSGSNAPRNGTVTVNEPRKTRAKTARSPTSPTTTTTDRTRSPTGSRTPAASAPISSDAWR